ncbi:14658_t:CDS:2, partial [Racocetra persica]
MLSIESKKTLLEVEKLLDEYNSQTESSQAKKESVCDVKIKINGKEMKCGKIFKYLSRWSTSNMNSHLADEHDIAMKVHYSTNIDIDEYDYNNEGRQEISNYDSESESSDNENENDISFDTQKNQSENQLENDPELT